MQNLLNKLKTEERAEVKDDVTFKQREKLRLIAESYKETLSKELTEDLLKWKKGEKY
jgi:hypothetical protein